MKFLIDECLSPKLADIARARGFDESTHVTWLGMRSRADWAIVRRAVDGGYVLVTNNAIDFAALVALQDIHCGLVTLAAAPGLMRIDAQRILFEIVLDRLGRDEPINEVVEATLVEEDRVLIERYPLPTS